MGLGLRPIDPVKLRSIYGQLELDRDHEALPSEPIKSIAQPSRTGGTAELQVQVGCRGVRCEKMWKKVENFRSNKAERCRGLPAASGGSKQASVLPQC